MKIKWLFLQLNFEEKALGLAKKKSGIQIQPTYLFDCLNSI